MSYLIIAFIGALILQLGAFASYTRLKRVDVVDVAWGLSAVAIIVSLHAYGSAFTPVVLLADILVVAWELRLAWYVARRIAKSKEQDPRYTAIMKKWSRKNINLQVLIKIFVFQALLATLVSLPVIVIHYYQPVMQPVIVVGLVTWLIGFGIEARADAQLRNFLRTAVKGEIMTGGLWKYSRHPNYFGEITMWWGIAFMAFSTPFWWAGALGALAITILISFVSGIPLAEKRMENKKNWESYKQRTSILIPLPPKK